MTPAQSAAHPLSENSLVLRTLFHHLARLGVTEYCVCAGARNAAIISALVRAPGVELYHFFDERSAAFFALGRVLQTSRPVAVLTTSGTAVAELLPAIVEAYYQALPLIAITADRPQRYIGSGAPQAIEQAGIFTEYAPNFIDVTPELELDEKTTFKAGPWHFNVRLEEGLDTQNDDYVSSGSSVLENAFDVHTQNDLAWSAFWQSTAPLVVLASGMSRHEAALAAPLLHHLQAPIIAEATANLHAHTDLHHLLIQGGEKALDTLPAGRVLRLGAVPSWRWWRDLDDRMDVPVLNISRAPFRGLSRKDQVYTQSWNAIPGWISALADVVLPGSPPKGFAAELAGLVHTYPHSEPAWMHHLSQCVASGASVFLGNSLPIREWNLTAKMPASGVTFYANRGANGIDGLTSTWLGTSQGQSESWLIIGDLSALYDMSAPWVLDQLSTGKRRLVVIHNEGGKIFSGVGWLRDMPTAGKKLMVNPHSLSFEPIARMWGMPYRRITHLDELQDDDSPCALWEVRPDHEQTASFWRDWQKV